MEEPVIYLGEGQSVSSQLYNVLEVPQTASPLPKLSLLINLKNECVDGHNSSLYLCLPDTIIFVCVAE